MKIELLEGEAPRTGERREKVFNNGASVSVSFQGEQCFLSICKTFKSKEPQHLSSFCISFDESEKESTTVFRTEYMHIILDTSPILDFFNDHKEFINNTSCNIDGVFVMSRERVIHVVEDKRFLKLSILDMSPENGKGTVSSGEIKFLKSLKFQQGKSVQEGKYSDAFLTRELGIPKATLSRWKTDTGWRKKVYDILNGMDFPSEDNTAV